MTIWSDLEAVISRGVYNLSVNSELQLPTYLDQPAIFVQFTHHTLEGNGGFLSHILIHGVGRHNRISIECGQHQSCTRRFTFIYSMSRVEGIQERQDSPRVVAFNMLLGSSDSS